MSRPAALNLILLFSVKLSDLSVSVIIPVYNGEQFLAEAIESIFRQKYEAVEIIAVDDGSTDETSKLLARLGRKVRTIRQPNSGPAAARNRGLKTAKSELIAFLDADDLWPDGRLASQVHYLTAKPSVQIVQGSIKEINLQNGCGATRVPNAEMSKYYFNVNLGALLCRRSVFEAVGLFDETLHFGEDMDFMIRAWEHGISKAFMNDVALIYRRHPGNMTHGVTPQRIFAKLLKKHLDRRRDHNPGRPQRSSIAEYLGWNNCSAS
jgi:glycosyltransferase involved in cell wall biosynthesis